MLTDPLNVTFNSVSTDLPRATGVYPGGEAKRLGQTVYMSHDGALVAFVTHTLVRGGHRKVEILLGSRVIDGDYDPFDREPVANYVGFVFITDKFGAEVSDIDLLDSCLRSKLDDTLRDRLIAGEN